VHLPVFQAVFHFDDLGPEEVKGKTAKAIYALDGDDLTWCVAEPGSGERPEKLATKEGVKHMLVKLKREKK
jgi:hypothetical protein